MPKKFLTILVLAASIGFGLAGSLLITPPAQAQAAGAKVGEKVGKLLQDALNASKPGKSSCKDFRRARRDLILCRPLCKKYCARPASRSRF